MGACKGHSRHSTKPRSFRVLILRHSPLDTHMCAHTLTHSATRSSQSTFAEQTLSPAQPHGVCPPRLPPFWKDRPPANLRPLQHQIFGSMYLSLLLNFFFHFFHHSSFSLGNCCQGNTPLEFDLETLPVGGIPRPFPLRGGFYETLSLSVCSDAKG